MNQTWEYCLFVHFFFLVIVLEFIHFIFQPPWTTVGGSESNAVTVSSAS